MLYTFWFDNQNSQSGMATHHTMPQSDYITLLDASWGELWGQSIKAFTNAVNQNTTKISALAAYHPFLFRKQTCWEFRCKASPLVLLERVFCDDNTGSI